VLEAGFLVLLAVVVGFADLDPPLIILVMTVGWLLVSLIEYFAWRQTQSLVMSRYEEAAPAPAVRDEVVEDVPPPSPPPAPAPQPAEEETVVQAPAQEEKETVAEADERVAAARASFTTEDKRTRHRLEPLQPRPRRRWILFGPHERRPEPPAEGDREEER
jgi:hypothetical protein